MEAEPDPGATSGPKVRLIILIRLQALDRERDSNQRLVHQTEGLVAARGARLEQARKVIGESTTELGRAKIAAHEAEVDLKARSDEVRKLELQLNTARTNQEYTALQTHIGKLRDASSREEEDTLVLYDRIEKLAAQVAAAKQKADELERERDQFRKTCEEDRASALAELESTEDRRNGLLAELPPDLRSTYDRLRTAREGIAVVACESRCCSGCGVRVKPNDLAHMKAVSQIVYCESCQRVLYLPESLQARPEQ
ncbi:MAG: C4-type zinc ribbon domain-containing protein [Planctomycetota bacterium]